MTKTNHDRPIPKRHKLRFSVGNDVDVGRACRRVGEMMGVESVQAELGCLIVDYDLRQATLAQIETVASEEGLKFKGGFHGLRRSLWKFSERNELDMAALPDTGACCSRPPTRLR